MNRDKSIPTSESPSKGLRSEVFSKGGTHTPNEEGMEGINVAIEHMAEDFGMRGRLGDQLSVGRRHHLGLRSLNCDHTSS